MLSTLGTKGKAVSSVSTRSRTKKCPRSMFLVRAWCSGIYARSMPDMLSMDKRLVEKKRGRAMRRARAGRRPF
eukprot:2595705-Pleurochrysis_carterae.AAC.2